MATRKGTPRTASSHRNPATLLRRLLDKTHYDRQNACWCFTGAGIQNGYGQIGVASGVAALAHRVSYELFCGEIPVGSMVLHTCDNRRCVKPSHLYLGDRLDNAADAVRKGRHAHGSGHGRAKLTEEQVRVIYARVVIDGELPDVVASDYEITGPTVRDIARGKNWKHLGLAQQGTPKPGSG